MATIHHSALWLLRLGFASLALALCLDGWQSWARSPGRVVDVVALEGGKALTLHRTRRPTGRFVERLQDARGMIWWEKRVPEADRLGVRTGGGEHPSDVGPAARIGEDDLIVTEPAAGGGSLRIIRRDGAAPARAFSYEDGPCVAGETVFFGDEEGIRGFEPSTSVLRRLELPPDPRGRRPRLAPLCGCFRDTVVLAITFEPETLAGDDRRHLRSSSARQLDQSPQSALVALDHRTYEQRWRLELPFELTGADQGSPGRLEPGGIPFSGELTRYVPVRLSSRAHDEGARLLVAMIDVAQGELAWVSPPFEERVACDLLTHRQFHYLVHGAGRTSLAVFDGATGELGRAVLLPTASTVRSQSFADGLLWIAYGDEAWPLDAVTLRPASRAEADGSLPDARAQTVEALGLER